MRKYEPILAKWKRPFRRPRKIRPGDNIEGSFKISDDEYLLIKEYANGRSVDEIAWGLDIHKSTVTRNLRGLMKKMIQHVRITREECAK